MSARKLKPKDPRGAHFRLYHSIMDGAAWNCLNATDQRAYFLLARQLTSFNNGDLSLPVSFTKPRGIANETTLAKCLRALQAVGLIAITRRTAHRPDGSRLPNLFRLTDRPVFAMPGKFIEACGATNEWEKVKTKAQGAALIREYEARWKEEWAKEVARREAKKAALEKAAPK